MVVFPLFKHTNDIETASRSDEAEPMDWVELLAAGTLLAGGILLLARRHRAGTVVAATGAALAMLDRQDTLRTWWDALPGYIDETQLLLGRVQGSVEELAAQRERLRKVLAK
jgi:hypothetical protein